jgi:hypothetical protein
MHDLGIGIIELALAEFAVEAHHIPKLIPYLFYILLTWKSTDYLP